LALVALSVVEQRLDAVQAVLSGARITEEAEPVLGLRVGGNPQVGGYFHAASLPQ
jgi:hypothetical protein